MNSNPMPRSESEARSSDQIAKRVQDFILDNFLFGDESRMPSQSDSLLQNEIIDSTGVLELIEFLEAEFQIQVDESETIPENLDSVENLIRFVSQKAE